MVHPAAEFLSIFRLVEPRKQIIYFRNTIVGQINDRHSNPKRERKRRVFGLKQVCNPAGQIPLGISVV